MKKTIESQSVGVLFPERNSNFEKVLTDLEDFIENNPVEFSKTEEEKLIESYENLEAQGLNGVLHIVHQGSPTGEILKKVLPEKWSNRFYHRLHIIAEEGGVLKDVLPEDIVVAVSRDGLINTENQSKLENAFRDRVGIISGGGAGGPKDPIYTPLIREMSKSLATKTPGAGICLGHQLYGEILFNWQQKETKGVVPGYLEGTTSVERVTPEGAKHDIFERLGDKFTVVSFNELHLILPESADDKLSIGKVLTRSASTGYPTSLSLDAEVPGQIITTQRHPELGMLGVGSEIIREDKDIYLPSGEKLTVLAGSHPDMLMLANYFSTHFGVLQEKFDFTERDVQELFTVDRMATNLGKDFFGPLLKYLADTRKKQ